MHWHAVACTALDAPIDEAENDAEALRHLDEVRTEDLKQSRENLGENLAAASDSTPTPR